MSRMRILLVTPFVPDKRVGHGTATVAAHFVEYFGRRHDVSVLSFSFDEREVTLADDVARRCAGMRTVPFPAGAARQWRRRVGSIVRGLPYTIALFDVPEMRAALSGILSRQPFDLVQFDTTFVGQYVDLVRDRQTHTALVEIDFSLRPLARRHERARPRLTRAWYGRELEQMRRYEPRLCGRFSRVVAVSAADRDELRQLEPSLDVKVFRYGAAPELFDVPAKDTNDCNVLFMGAFLHQPNVEAAAWLCNAILPTVRRAVPSVACSCIGGAPPEWLERVAVQSGVTMPGWVPEVRGYLARADVGVAPLLSGGGVKLKTLEMMAAGKAIVTTRIGIEGIDARDGEHVLVAEDAETFARQIVRLLKDEHLRKRLGRQARELALRNHQWSRNLRELEEDYVNLVHGADMVSARAV